MDRPLRVAYTLEQCWHDVPGGTAVAALEVASRLLLRSDIELVGVAGRHSKPPLSPFEPPMPVNQLLIARPWLYETWNRFGIPRVERATGPVDVCHSTTAIPAATKAPHVVTVHDVAFMHAPERFTRHGARVMRAGLKRCRLADLVLCSSSSTRDDLIGLDFNGDQVRVVPLGVTPVSVSQSDIARVRKTHELPEQFVLFVGTREPRKNLDRLIEAMRLLKSGLRLVVVGASGWGDQNLEQSAQVRYIGFVTQADLPAIYAASTLFAYPSLGEGFGLPVIEAMAQGIPVVTSRGTATEETAGGAAVLVDPYDVESIASGITETLNDVDRWSAAGTARAAMFTWEATALATIDAYREVAR